MDRMEHREIGNCQGWGYPADKTAILWEAYVFDHYRAGDDPTRDEALKVLWTGFERILLERSPRVAHIVVPSWEPIYEEGTVWQDFLRAQGYQPFNEQAFAKEVASYPCQAQILASDLAKTLDSGDTIRVLAWPEQTGGGRGREYGIVQAGCQRWCARFSHQDIVMSITASFYRWLVIAFIIIVVAVAGFRVSNVFRVEDSKTAKEPQSPVLKDERDSRVSQATTEQFTFTVQVVPSDAYSARPDDKARPLVPLTTSNGQPAVTLNPAASGQTAVVPVGTYIFLHFGPGNYQVSFAPQSGVVEKPKGITHLPKDTIGLLLAVGVGNATITVTQAL